MTLPELPIFKHPLLTHPVYGTFIRLTLMIAGALIALFLAIFLLKVILFAAIVAALVAVGLALYRRFFGPKSLKAKPVRE